MGASQSVFDKLLTVVQVEDEPGIEDAEQGAKAILASLQGIAYTPPQRVTTPIYEPPPIPLLTKDSPVKTTVSKGIFEGYCTIWYKPDGDIYIDPMDEWVAPGSFQETIEEARKHMQAMRKDYLLPMLYSHDRKDVIGKVVEMAEDRTGVAFRAKALQTARAQDIHSLASEGVLGVSYGYLPIVKEYSRHPKTGKDYTKITKLKCYELTATAFPANDLTMLHAKSRFYVPPNYPGKQPAQGATQSVNWHTVQADMKKADALFDQLTNQGIQAFKQWQYEAEKNRVRIIPGKGSF